MDGYYRIKNWNEIYENSQSRKLKSISWVPIPNKHDGRKFRELALIDPSGGAFAAFILMVEIASKCDTRGDLLDSDGQPLKPYDLYLMTGYPAELFEKALETLCSKRIGWIEIVPIERSSQDTPSPAIESEPISEDVAGHEEDRCDYAKLKELAKAGIPYDIHNSKMLGSILYDRFKELYPKLHGVYYVASRWDEKTMQSLVELNGFEAIDIAISNYFKVKDHKHSVKMLDQHASDNFARLLNMPKQKPTETAERIAWEKEKKAGRGDQEEKEYVPVPRIPRERFYQFVKKALSKNPELKVLSEEEIESYYEAHSTMTEANFIAAARYLLKDKITSWPTPAAMSVAVIKAKAEKEDK